MDESTKESRPRLAGPIFGGAFLTLAGFLVMNTLMVPTLGFLHVGTIWSV